MVFEAEVITWPSIVTDASKAGENSFFIFEEPSMKPRSRRILLLSDKVIWFAAPVLVLFNLNTLSIIVALTFIESALFILSRIVVSESVPSTSISTPFT